jgi:hypothetical protein
LHTLHALSKLQDRGRLNFIIIGALPLLVGRYLRYRAFWDIDLLFKNKRLLAEFITTDKSPRLKIFHYRDRMMTSRAITSFHTAWGFENIWCNVDYIFKDRIYGLYMYRRGKSSAGPQLVEFDHGQFHIALYFAHPWDVVIDKLTSPRLKRDLDLRIDVSVDIRHVFRVYEREKDNPDFWKNVLKRAGYLGRGRELKRNFSDLLKRKDELGYQGIRISKLAREALSG